MKKLLLILSLLALPAMVSTVLPSAAHAAVSKSKLGDLSKFEAIAEDTLTLVAKGDMAAAEKRITDFESAWDAAEPTLYPKDKKGWGVIDKAADGAISSLRTTLPDAGKARSAVSTLIRVLQP